MSIVISYRKTLNEKRIKEKGGKQRVTWKPESRISQIQISAFSPSFPPLFSIVHPTKIGAIFLSLDSPT